MSHDFKVGDRVEANDVYRKAHPAPIGGKFFLGEVIHIDGDLIHVKRDDGVRGLGINGGFRVYAQHLDLLGGGYKPVEEPTQQRQHVAGLDPEQIDFDAGRDLI
jgi:hypothetical protein